MLAAKRRDENFEQNLETGEPEPPRELPPEADLVRGGLWMFGITMLLFFLPVINGIIAGIIGGFKVGSTKNAVMAALVPAMAAALFLWILVSVTHLPILGATNSSSIMALLVVLSITAMLLGAAIGGTMAQNKIDRFNRA